MIEITAKIKQQNNSKTELLADWNGREITIDPCVGCAIPYSVFTNYNFIGNEYYFEGNWYGEDESLFLPDMMCDPFED